MKNNSTMVRTMITTIINRLVLFSVPTKSSIGVNVITCQGLAEAARKLAKAAIKSPPLMGDWNANLSAPCECVGDEPRAPRDRRCQPGSRS